MLARPNLSPPPPSSVVYIDCTAAADPQPSSKPNPFKASAAMMEERVKQCLASSLSRVTEFFATMDANGDGKVSRKEFSRGLIALGVCPLSLRAAVDAVFDSWDADSSGELDFREMHAKLRNSASAPKPEPPNHLSAA